MTASVKVSGAWKAVNRASVKVSGSWKTVAQGYAKVSGVWKPFLGQSFDLNTEIGTFISVYNGIGYNDGAALDTPHGSLNPISYKSATIAVIEDFTDGASDFGAAMFMTIGADPGQSYFSDITVNGVTLASASASYGFGTIAPTIASWIWSGTPFGLTQPTGYTVIINE